MRIVIMSAVLFLFGCASDGYNPITGQSTQPGTYSFDADRDSFHIEAATIKGGPEIRWVTHPDGSTELHVSPSQQLVLDALLELL